MLGAMVEGEAAPLEPQRFPAAGSVPSSRYALTASSMHFTPRPYAV